MTLIGRLSAAASLAALAACGGPGGAAPSDAKGGGDMALQTEQAPLAPEGALDLAVEVLAEGLVNPWGVAFLPNGDILVTERAGRLRVVRDGGLVPAPVGGVPAVHTGNQAGLFDVLLHRDFAENGVLFLAYAHGTPDANGLRVARATFDGATLSDLQVLYDAHPLKDSNHHYGGKLAYGGDGKLYVTIGEGSRYKERAQDMTSSFGAIVRLNEDGSIPPDNAAFGAGSSPELWTKGHRNPQGLVWDAGRGLFWTHEHGPKGGDELNIVEKGANYGWPLASYGTDYNGARITPFTEYEGTKQPFKYWTPSPGLSGLAVYDGEVFPADWRGDLLMGALAQRHLKRLDMEGDAVVKEEIYLVGERIRDVRAGPDGAIYATTEDRGGAPVGKLLRLTPKPQD